MKGKLIQIGIVLGFAMILGAVGYLVLGNLPFSGPDLTTPEGVATQWDVEGTTIIGFGQTDRMVAWLIEVELTAQVQEHDYILAESAELIENSRQFGLDTTEFFVFVWVSEGMVMAEVDCKWNIDYASEPLLLDDPAICKSFVSNPPWPVPQEDLFANE